MVENWERLLLLGHCLNKLMKYQIFISVNEKIKTISNSLLKNYQKYNLFWLLFLSFLFGLLTTILLYGKAVIDFTSINWILANGDGDQNQHFVGWQAFRSESWHFPITKISNLLYPNGTSVVYTDSIPGMAILFKLVKWILPTNFQYFGIWTVLAYMLQFFFSVKISHRFTKNLLLDILIAAFFLTSLPIHSRMLVHSALGGHFIILASILLLINNKYDKKYLYYWGIVNVSTLLIHAYFVFITMAVWCGYLINCLLFEKNKKYVVMQVLVNFTAVGFAAFILGYFDFYPSTGENFFEVLSSSNLNLNGLVNPGSGSLFLKGMPIAPIRFSHEGIYYLGIGIISLLFFGIIISIMDKFNSFKGKGKIIGLLAAIIVTTIFALGTKIYWGDKLLFSYDPKLPSLIKSFFMIFRSNGRMSWLLYYIIYLFGFYIIVHHFRHTSRIRVAVVLTMVFALQIIDISPSFITKRNLTVNADKIKYETKFDSNFWNMLPVNIEHFNVIPYEQSNCNELALLSYKNGWTYSSFRAARVDIDAARKYADEEAQKLASGIINDNTFYRHGYNVRFLKSLYDMRFYDHFMVDGQLITTQKGLILNEGTDFFRITDIEEVDIASFISMPENNKIYVLSAKQELKYFMDNEAVKNAFKSIGASIVDENDSYMLIWMGGEYSNIIENKSRGVINWKINKNDTVFNVTMPVSLSVSSLNRGYSSIIVDGIETSPNFSGFSITVFDIESGDISCIVIADQYWVSNGAVKLTFGNPNVTNVIGSDLSSAYIISGYYADNWVSPVSNFYIRTRDSGLITVQGYYPGEITKHLTGTVYINGDPKAFSINENLFTVFFMSPANEIVSVRIKNDFTFEHDILKDSREFSFVLTGLDGE